MVYTDQQPLKAIGFFLAIVLLIVGIFLWSRQINPITWLQGSEQLAQVTGTTQPTATPVRLPELLTILGEHDAAVNRHNASQRYKSTERLLDALIQQF